MPQYVTAVSRYNELLKFDSPTHASMVYALVRAYENKNHLQNVVHMTRVGLPAGILRHIGKFGLGAADVDTKRYCDSVVFESIF